MLLSAGRRNKLTVRIQVSGAANKARFPKQGDYIFESRTHLLYVTPNLHYEPGRSLTEAEIAAQSYLAVQGQDTEVRFRGVQP